MFTWRSTFLAVSFAAGVCSPALAQFASQAQAGKIVVFDGSQDPSTIPDHVAWEAGFRMLAKADRDNIEGIKRSLDLPASDEVLVYQAARGQTDRDARCYGAQERRKTEMLSQKRSLEDVYDALKIIVLGCRERVLETADKLVAAMTVEGQLALSAWIEERRKTIQSHVPEEEVEFYRLPR